LIEAVRTVWEKTWGIYAAVIVRLLLGVLLIFAAPDARFPVVFKALGALFIVAAIVIPFVGRTRLSALMNWFALRSPSLVRLWLLLGMAFGGFLIYDVS
jgi:predicted transporter